MSITLHVHPLSSFCHKALVGAYENNVPFTQKMVNLQSDEGRAEYYGIWSIGKMPVLEDSSRKKIIPEASLILEYIDQNYRGAVPLFPHSPDQCLEARYWDRIIDLYLHMQMQKVVNDVRKPESDRDPRGVADAKALMTKVYDLLEKQLIDKKWILGDEFSIADCSALPALFYGNCAQPYSETHPKVFAYAERLFARPSSQRVHEEAKPYFKYFPLAAQLPARYRS